MKNILIMTTILLTVSFYSLSFAVDKQCEFCHKEHSATGALLNDDINQLCSSCHMERMGKGEHKVGVSPSTPVKELPLSDGKIVCTTCHDPHSKGPKMLRKSGSELCLNCHTK